MSWIGGKKALRELIVRLFPLYYERYIEVFGGGGWVLFHKPPGNDFEVYNDFNGLLVNLYRCVRDKPEELMEALRYVLNAREDFDRIRSALARDSPASDVQRAAWFYQLIRYSYASGLTSFGSQPHDMRSNFPLIEQAHRRLAKVVIENKDFEKLLRQYDRPVSFFYLDPPYRKAVTQVGMAWGLPIPDTQRWLDLIRQEEIAVAQAANPEKVNHVMEEKDLPINASGLQTLDNIWGLFETAVKLNSADGRREMYALARELSECQNLTDWIIKSQTENEGAQVSMACTQN